MAAPLPTHASPRACSGAPIRLDPFRPETDADEVANLYLKVFGVSAPPEAATWKYCPPWSEAPVGVVGRQDGGLVGFAACVPLRGVLEGEEVPFLQFTDFMVDPALRGRYDLVTPTNALFDHVRAVRPSAIFYGFTGRRPLSLYQRAGLAELLEEGLDLVHRPGPPVVHPPLEVTWWDWAGDEVEAVWVRARPSMRAGLIRDGAYLRWRYGDHPLYRYALLGLCCGGDPVGWAVAGEYGLKGTPQAEARLIDLLIPDDLLPVGLDAVARALQAEALVFWRPISENAPSERRPSGMFSLHFHRNAPVPTDLLRGRLYYTLGDSDQW